MTPQISEFSYGFALTNELVGWLPLRAAPIFPSLIEEGKSGGGYDVKLDAPGIPLFLQFKRADCMVTRRAREISVHGLKLKTPFFRFPITDKATSAQHEMLLELDKGPNVVFYAAPRFYKVEEINSAWKAKAVASRSIFVSPKTIGSLSYGKHYISYDDRRQFVCSEPREIRALSSADLAEKLLARLLEDDRPLRQVIPEALAHAREAPTRARRRIERRLSDHDTGQGPMAMMADIVEYLKLSEAAAEVPVPVARPRQPRSPEEAALRELSDLAASEFFSQLVVVQQP